MGNQYKSHPDGSKLPADKGTFSRENADKPAPIPFPWVTSLPTGTVTFLFTDIEGNTPLWERAPAAMEAAMEVHNAVLRQAVETQGGVVFKTVGDEFQAAFPTAPQALAAAVDAQRGLASAPWNELGPLRVRMGIHTGEAHLDTIGDEYAVSHTKNRTSRVMAAGHGSQILLSQESAELCKRELPEGMHLKDLGRHRMKGLAHLEHLFQAVVSGLQEDFPPLRTLETRPHNLPIQLTSFIGREAEIARIGQMFHKSRLVTLTGPGGTGKTRLALQSAAELLERFPDGCWLVELAPIVDPDQVTVTAASAMGMRLQAGPQALSFLEDYLAPKQLLLIFDNCEHLIFACMRLADALLHACPKLSILVSSREALGIEGEAPLLVPPLSLPDPGKLPPLEELDQYEAVRLFVERACISSPAFDLTASNALAVVQVCQRLDGIPLAIELAAARVKMLQVGEIAARLDDRFRLLTGGSRAALPRYQTLRASIDWSYALLSPAEQRLLQRLSVFAGGWTLEGAEAVGCGEEIEACEVLDLLGQLVNKSLVTVGIGQSGETRYGMLETIRQYAQEKLVEAGGAEAARDRHLQYYVEMAEKEGNKIRGPDQATATIRLETELDNLRLAMEWSLENRSAAQWAIESGLRLAYSLGWFWHIRGHHVEAAIWLARLLDLEVEERGDRLMSPEIMNLRGQILCLAGVMVSTLGKAKQQKKWYEEARILYEQLGQEGRSGYAWSLYCLSDLAADQADFHKAEELQEESLAIFRELQESFALSEVLMASGFREGNRQHYERAGRYFEEELALKMKINDQDGVAMALANLGAMALFQDDLEKARGLLNESRVIFNQLKNTWGLCYPLLYLGILNWRVENYADASQHFNDILSLGRRQGDVNWISIALSNLGRLAQSQGDRNQAGKWYSENLTFSRRNDALGYIALSLGDLGNLAFEEDNLEEAVNLYTEAQKIYQEMGVQSPKASAVFGLGRVALVRDDYPTARLCLLEALNLQPYSEGVWLGASDGSWSAFYTLEALGLIASAQQQYDRAAILLGATEAWHQRKVHTRMPKERELRLQAMEELRLAIDEVSFAAAWEAGQALTLEEAVAYAMRESD